MAANTALATYVTDTFGTIVAHNVKSDVLEVDNLDVHFLGIRSSPVTVSQVVATGPSPPVVSSTTVNANNVVTVNGSSEPNATIYIFSDGVQVGTGSANNSGAFSVSTKVLTPGTHTIAVNQSTGQDLVSEFKSAGTIIAPQPPPPIITEVTTNDNNTIVTVKGTSVPGAFIEIYANDAKVGSGYADNVGSFTVVSRVLRAGSYIITATQGIDNSNVNINTNVQINGDVVTGTSTSKLSFYGLNPIARQSISRLDTVFGTPSLYDTAQKVNSILEALSAVGLIQV